MSTLGEATAVTIQFVRPVTAREIEDAILIIINNLPERYSETLYREILDGKVHLGQRAGCTEDNISVGPAYNESGFQPKVPYGQVVVWCNPRIALDVYDDYDGDDWAGYVRERVATFARRLTLALGQQ